MPRSPAANNREDRFSIQKFKGVAAILHIRCDGRGYCLPLLGRREKNRAVRQLLLLRRGRIQRAGISGSNSRYAKEELSADDPEVKQMVSAAERKEGAICKRTSANADLFYTSIRITVN